MPKISIIKIGKIKLQELKAELQSKEATLDKIAQRYDRLSPSPDSRLAGQQVEPLREHWQQLLEKLDSHLKTRRYGLRDIII